VLWRTADRSILVELRAAIAGARVHLVTQFQKNPQEAQLER
jgi:hypothetical protein